MAKSQDFSSIPLANDEGGNYQPRCSCVLLLDTSSSMYGPSIDSLNEGIRVFADELRKDPLARLRVEPLVVTFDSTVKIHGEFSPALEFEPPVLSTSGSTEMAEGVLVALNLLDQRNEYHKSKKLPRYKPWIFMITDGGPTGTEESFRNAVTQLRKRETNKEVVFFGVGVAGADMAKLAELSARPPVKLDGLNFRELFIWLSSSLGAVSRSSVDDTVALPPLTWNAI